MNQHNYQSTKYIQHTLNHSPSKAAFSFGKSQRFAQLYARRSRSRSRSYQNRKTSKSNNKKLQKKQQRSSPQRGILVTRQNSGRISPTRSPLRFETGWVSRQSPLNKTFDSNTKKTSISRFPPRNSSKSLSPKKGKKLTNEEKYSREKRKSPVNRQGLPRSRSRSPPIQRNYSPQKISTGIGKKYLPPSSIQRGNDGKFRVIDSFNHKNFGGRALNGSNKKIDRSYTDDYQQYQLERVGPGAYQYQKYQSPGKYVTSNLKNAPSYSFSQLPRECQVQKYESSKDENRKKSKSISKKDQKVIKLTDLYTPFSEFGNL